MTIHFDFYRNPSDPETIGEKPARYHARVVDSQIIDLDNIVDHISHRCTLSKGDIQAVIGELSDEIAHGLCDGNRVAIPGIGFFSLSLEAPKDAQPNQTRCQSVKLKRIEYRSDLQLKNKVMSHASFERCKEKRHSAALNIYEIDALLIDYFEENKFLTRQKFAQLCQFTRVTACRHLNRLVDEGRLKNTNTLRSPIYEPVKGYYNK